MYNPKSTIATEFIDDQEIRDTLRYADENKDNLELINRLIDKTDELKGLTHREAAVLLACEDKDALERIFAQAAKIKQEFYGNRIVMFAPLYLSNYCVNGCTYCPYHKKNGHIARKKLTQEEIRREVIALQDMGHKRLALETGEDPVNNPIEYVLESIKTIYSIKHKNGAIRRVNVNIAATTVENYRKLKEAGIGTYILFQETYNKEQYEKLHPTGPKSNSAYHTEAMDRAMQGGIDDVGCGVLFGLNLYRYDFVGLLMHAEHLEARAFQQLAQRAALVEQHRAGGDADLAGAHARGELHGLLHAGEVRAALARERRRLHDAVALRLAVARVHLLADGLAHEPLHALRRVAARLELARLAGAAQAREPGTVHQLPLPTPLPWKRGRHAASAPVRPQYRRSCAPRPDAGRLLERDGGAPVSRPPAG